MQRKGQRDQRQRLLQLTEKGLALERALSEKQRDRFARAFREAGAEAVEGFRQVMLNLMDEGTRKRFVENDRRS